jgi:hypothetical protein
MFISIISIFFIFCSGQNDENNKSELQIGNNSNNTDNSNNQEENGNNETNQTVSEVTYPIEGEVTGTLRLVGNDPHLELVIYGKSNYDDISREYRIKGDLIDELKEFVYEKVHTTGLIEKHKIRYANSDDFIVAFSIDVKKYSILED